MAPMEVLADIVLASLDCDFEKGAPLSLLAQRRVGDRWYPMTDAELAATFNVPPWCEEFTIAFPTAGWDEELGREVGARKTMPASATARDALDAIDAMRRDAPGEPGARFLEGVRRLTDGARGTEGGQVVYEVITGS
jgi:hypothetical protein